MKYLVQRTDDGSLHVIGNIAKDPGYTVVGQAPAEAEHASDLDILTETDDMGMERKTIVVNAERRQARLDAEAQALATAEQVELDRKAKREAARARVAEVAAKKPASMADIQEALRLLVEQGVL